MKSAFITGVAGQDGSYLAEFLLKKGYKVWGLVRRSSDFNSKRIDHLLDDKNFYTFFGDLSDTSSIYNIIRKIDPDEVYNLAAQSHVRVSFDMPEYTSEINGTAVCRLLSILKEFGAKCKFYQASTSELFGGFPGTTPQNEGTPFKPASPYATSKLFSFWSTVNYREAYGLFAANGILFNHESPRRGKTFVTKKITKAVAAIEKKKISHFSIGNLDAQRDWGYAPDFVEGMWKMLQLSEPVDLVLGTGTSHTVRAFIEKAFKIIDTEIQWSGVGTEEKGYCARSGKILVVVDPIYYRPSEVHELRADCSKAKELINWSPSVDLDALVKKMVDYDLMFDEYGEDRG